MPKICLIAGIGINDCTSHTKTNPHYIKWDSMLRRCYSKNTRLIYQESFVDEIWLRFSNFEAWSKENWFEGAALDKDIIVRGNKCYSPKTSRYVPREINNLILVRQTDRGEYPLGVSRMKPCSKSTKGRTEPFIAKVSEQGKTKNLGYFSDPVLAHRAWQWEKANQIEKAVAWYATQDCFKTDVADALTQRVWQLRLDFQRRVETKEL